MSKQVTIEYMPQWLVASHEAAGNWGRYPDNGSVREKMSEERAQHIVDNDRNGYAKIIAPAHRRPKGEPGHARQAARQAGPSIGLRRVRQAISQSQSHNEIVSIDDDVGVLAELKKRTKDAANGGSVLNDRIYEFWGGVKPNEWRVHVRVSAKKKTGGLHYGRYIP